MPRATLSRPDRAHAPPGAGPRTLRLLERLPPPPQPVPLPPSWSARLGRWLDRLITS